MAYISSNYDNNPDAKMGTWVGDGQCVAYVRAVSGAPNTGFWRRGALVKGSTQIRAGTVIATFSRSGHYSGHKAIYRGQGMSGIDVTDQWVNGGNPTPIHHRTIRFRGGNGSPVDDGDQYYVVE